MQGCTRVTARISAGPGHRICRRLRASMSEPARKDLVKQESEPTACESVVRHALAKTQDGFTRRPRVSLPNAKASTALSALWAHASRGDQAKQLPATVDKHRSTNVSDTRCPW